MHTAHCILVCIPHPLDVYTTDYVMQVPLSLTGIVLLCNECVVSLISKLVTSVAMDTIGFHDYNSILTRIRIQACMGLHVLIIA